MKSDEKKEMSREEMEKSDEKISTDVDEIRPDTVFVPQHVYEYLFQRAYQKNDGSGKI